MFQWRALPGRGEASPGPFLTIPTLAAAGIQVAFTSRLGGVSREPFRSLNLSLVAGDDRSSVLANRAHALAAVGAPLEAWTSGRQVHGAQVARVGPAERGSGAHAWETTIPETDALFTDLPGTALVVLTADCLPLVLADRARRIVAVVHVGWRGLVAGIVQQAAEAIGDRRSLEAYAGPSIGPCCYEVGDEVAEMASRALGDEVVRADGSVRLDLWRGTRAALRRAGVPGMRLAALCTRCESHRFFSHRAGDAGRQGALVYLEP